MKEQYIRTAMLIGEVGVEKLRGARVCVFGVGGVGGYAAEALARSGVGAIELVDSDRVAITNINRQIIATRESVDRLKTEVMRERILSIDPEIEVVCHSFFFDKDTKCKLDFTKYDYIIDAIDSLSSKIELIETAKALSVRIISAMGAGNKLDPTKFEVSDISKTSVCPLARAVRTALRKKQIYHLKVVYSKEEPVCPPEISEGEKKRPPASISFVPSVMGLILAGEVIKDISGVNSLR